MGTKNTYSVYRRLYKSDIFKFPTTPSERFTLYLHTFHTFRERCEGDLTGKRTWYCSGGKHVHQSTVLQLLHVQEIRRWLFRILIDGSRWLVAIKSWLGLYLWLIHVDFRVLVTLQPLIRWFTLVFRNILTKKWAGKSRTFFRLMYYLAHLNDEI